jgi:hypothetical protein
LEHAGILVDDAERAQVTHMPNVPFVQQNPEVQVPSQPQQ